MKIQDIRGFKQQSPVEEMKEFVLSFAREFKLDTGHALPSRPLQQRTMNLNPKQKEVLIPAIKELVKDGVFEERDDQYILSMAGRDVLYP